MELDHLNPNKMYTIVRGKAKDGTSKSMELEGNRLYVYRGYMPMGIYFSVSKAIEKFNSL